MPASQPQTGPVQCGKCIFCQIGWNQPHIHDLKWYCVRWMEMNMDLRQKHKGHLHFWPSIWEPSLHIHWAWCCESESKCLPHHHSLAFINHWMHQHQNTAEAPCESLSLLIALTKTSRLRRACFMTHCWLFVIRINLRTSVSPSSSPYPPIMGALWKSLDTFEPENAAELHFKIVLFNVWHRYNVTYVPLSSPYAVLFP